MKIGLVLEKFDPRNGGLEHWTWQFAHELIGRGHEVHVVAFHFGETSAITGLCEHRLRMPASRWSRAEALEKALRTLEFDVIHDMGVGWSADIIHPHGGSTLATWEHNLLRIPRWRQIRFWREKRYREAHRIERRQHEGRALIVAVSHMVRRHFETLHHLPAERLRVIYNGVNTERFSPASRAPHRARTRQELGATADDVILLLLAHNLRLKNADTLIRATGELVQRSRPVRLVIAGGRKTAPYARLAEQVGAAGRVTLMQAVADPVPLYAATDLYVQPTWYDPCSLVTLEAWACGLPVITTCYNGATELMDRAQHGPIIDDPSDASALAVAIEPLLDQTTRERIGEAARELALRHSFARQTDEFLALYDEVIASRRRRP